MTALTEHAPTSRQLSYLRVLAARTATTFVSPGSRVQASREIARLRKLRAQPAERRPGQDAEALTYATAAHADELTGFGSSARWRSTHPGRNAAVQPTGTPVGPRELARYTVSTGTRVLRSSSDGQTVRITDRPASGPGESYVVEEALAASEVTAVVEDYLATAKDLDEVPMAPAALCQVLGAGSHV